MKFQKGHKKVGGRTAGTPNKNTELRERITVTPEDIQNDISN